MPSFMSISARVQELFRKNQGGVISPPPPRRLRDNGDVTKFTSPQVTYIKKIRDMDVVGVSGLMKR